MRSNSILITRHYSDLSSASDWLKKIFLAARPMRIWIVTRHQYGISAIGPKTSFRRETSSDVMKCRLFSQDTQVNNLKQNGGSGVYQFSGYKLSAFFLPQSLCLWLCYSYGTDFPFYKIVAENMKFSNDKFPNPRQNFDNKCYEARV